MAFIQHCLSHCSCESTTLEDRDAYYPKCFETGVFLFVYQIVLEINFINTFYVSLNQGLHEQFSASNVGVNVGAANLCKHFIVIMKLMREWEDAFFWLRALVTVPMQSLGLFLRNEIPLHLVLFLKTVVLWKLILIWQGNLSTHYKDSCYKGQIPIPSVKSMTCPTLFSNGTRAPHSSPYISTCCFPVSLTTVTETIRQL